MCTLFYLFIYYIYVCLQNVIFLANKTLQCHSVMVDKYKNKSCFDYEWMSYIVLTQNSTYAIIEKYNFTENVYIILSSLHLFFAFI